MPSRMAWRPGMKTEQPMNEQNLGHKELKALAKARRPWYLKKRFWALGVVGVIIIASVAGSGGGDADKDDNTTALPGAVSDSDTGSDAKLFPGRPDSQKEDKERNIGQ